MHSLRSPYGIRSPFGQRRAALDPARGGRAGKTFFRSMQTMFPDYLSGDRIVCSVPAIPEWPVAVAGILGDRIDCAAPTPGATPNSGMYHILDCAEAIP